MTDKAPYTLRATGGGAAGIGDRAVEKIVGGTVCWNQLVDPSAAATGTGSGVTFTNNGDGSWTLTGTCTGSKRWSLGMAAALASRVGHIVCVTHGADVSGVTADVDAQRAFSVCFTNGSGVIKTSLYEKGWYLTVVPAGYDSATGPTFDIRALVGFQPDTNGLTLRPQLFDLTEMFGATVAQAIYDSGTGSALFHSLFPNDYYAYNAGELMSVQTSGKRAVGFNLFDKDTAVTGSAIDANTGAFNTGDRRWRSGYIEVLPNTVYCLSGMGETINHLVAFYTTDKAFLSRTGGFSTNLRTFTTPADCRYIVFAQYGGDGTANIETACLHLAWDGSRNGEYEPYKSQLYPLDSSLTLRGIPKWDSEAGAMYYDGDEYASDGTVTRRYGIVDLGTLNWIYANERFRAELNNAVVPANTKKANAIATGYLFYSANTNFANTDKAAAIMPDSVKNLLIRDSSYTDAASFKAAMSGVYLVYELATPTTESADPYTSPQWVDNWGTEEFVDARTGASRVAVPVGHVTDYPVDLKAKLESAPGNPDMDGDYVMRRSGGQNSYVLLQESADEMTETVTGSTPEILAESGWRYVCGTVTELTFTPCASGTCSVRFVCGTTVPVLTLPNTVIMPGWWKGVEANHTYAITITDGVYAEAAVWKNDGSAETYTDTTLTTTGMAADAKATGDAIADVTSEVSDVKSALQEKSWDIGSNNRFDKTDVVNGIISKTGVISDSSDWKVSGFIPVVPGMVLYAYGHSAANFAMYTIEKMVVSNSTSWSNPFTVPANVSYIRMTINAALLDVAYVSTVDAYDDFKRIMPTVRQIESTLTNSIKNSVSKDVEFSVSGALNRDYGTISVNANFACTPLIPLKGIITKLQYKIKTVNTIAMYCFYDITGTFISSVVGGTSAVSEVGGNITTYPNNAAFVRFCSNIQGSYTPFIGAYGLGDIELNGKCVDVENVEFTRPNSKSNLIDMDTVALGYINGSTDGSVHSSTTMYCTWFIPLETGKQYYFNSNYLYPGYCAFYNANKEYISGYSASSSSSKLPTPFTPPTGARFGRFTIASESRLANAWLCELNRMGTKPPDYSDEVVTDFLAENPTDYKGNEISVFNKILCIGDSLTDGFFNESGGSRLIMRNRSYPAKLQALTGVECTNMGYAGYTSAQWYSAYSSADLSGHDACIIQLGVNDELYSVTESDMDTALTNIINKVKNDNAGIKIFVATIIPANGYMTTGMRSRSQMIRDFVDDLDDDDVYLVDLWMYGHSNDSLAYDAGHLSALGYLRLAEDYKAYISYIIHSTPLDFRYVQIIGTNYTYSGDEQTRQITY